MRIAKVIFSDSIGGSDFFWGTTLQDVRYAVEGYSAFDGQDAPKLPEIVELHFWKCYGGEVFEGYAIYNYLRDLAKQGVVVKSYSHGLTASIAVLIYLAGDERYTDDASLFFTHKPSCDLGMSPNANDMRAEAATLDKIQAQMATVYATRGGMSAEQAHVFMDSDSWITASEAVAAGFATARTDGELVAPTGAEKVINYIKFPTNNQAMPITEADETRLVDRFLNAAKSLFVTKNEAPAEAAVPMNSTYAVGDKVKVKAGKEHMPEHAGMEMTIAEIDSENAENYAVELPDGTIHKWYTADELEASDGMSMEAASNEAPEPATNSADLEAKDARIAELERDLGIATNKLTLAQNKLNKVVPGSAGNPTPAGSTPTPTNKVVEAPAKADPALDAFKKAFTKSK